jgi:hypothetical protein
MPTETWACAAAGTNASAAAMIVAKPKERRMRMIFNLPASPDSPKRRGPRENPVLPVSLSLSLLT